MLLTQTEIHALHTAPIAATHLSRQNVRGSWHRIHGRRQHWLLWHEGLQQWRQRAVRSLGCVYVYLRGSVGGQCVLCFALAFFLGEW
jgi:hypothetical protein